MEQQQQQQPPQPPSSPITKTANITASNVLNQGIQNAVGVTRSTSTGSGGGSTVMSGNSGTAGSGTQGSLGNTSGTTNNNVRQNSMGSEVSNSFRSSSNPSPLNTPRNIPTNFANVGVSTAALSNNAPPTNVAPPPWPTTTNNNNNNNNIPTSPQRSTQQPSIAAAVTMTPMRQIPSAQPSDKIPAGSISAGNTPLHGNTNTNFIRQQPTQSSNSGSGGSGAGLQPPILTTDTSLSFPQLSLSMTKSGESLFSSGAPTSNQGRISDGSGGGTASATGDFNRSTTDTSVLLGLEELERQQAHVEQRRAEEQQRVAAAEEQQRIQQQQQLQQAQQQNQMIQGQGQAQMNQLTPRGLPPLAPTSTQQQPHQQQQRPNTTGDVPNQIQILEDSDENTLLSSEAGGASKSEMKRVVSIEKLRGSVSTGLRRFRSWSQDALNRQSIDNPANSVDSTHPATLTSGEEGQQQTIGGSERLPRGSRHGSSHQQQQQLKSKNKSNQQQQSIISEPFLDDDELKPLIYGYLHKLGRNGHWQKRFFETNGERLTYYKSVKRTKVLATLDLCKVGEIAIDQTDPEECSFTIQVKGRPYYLRAEDKARCNDWVIILNRAREARMNVGNIQLVTNKEDGVVVEGGGHRSQAGSDDYAQPCIVISALRPRTKAVVNFEGNADLQNQPPDLLSSNTTEEEQIEVEFSSQGQLPSPSSSQQQGVVGVVGASSASSPMPSSPTGMAKWQKRHSKMHMLSLRFLKWARSITHQADACRRESDVVVVPAHVVSSMQQSMAKSAASSSIGTNTAGVGGPQQQQRPGHHSRKPSSGLPDVIPEESQQAPSTPSEMGSSTHNRSRTSTESPSFGSTYV